jgi:hypothetical protein
MHKQEQKEVLTGNPTACINEAFERPVVENHMAILTPIDS